jgi:hypothetical protein
MDFSIPGLNYTKGESVPWPTKIVGGSSIRLFFHAACSILVKRGGIGEGQAFVEDHIK